MPLANTSSPHCAVSRAQGLAFIAAFIFALTASAAGESPLTDFDVHSAEAKFATFARTGFSTLHEVPAGPDGVKSLSLQVEEYRSKISGPAEPPFTAVTDEQAFFAYCAFPNIVLAQNSDSLAVLSSARDTIFTISHFMVLGSLRGELKPGDTIVAYRLGGEVVDAAETLRIDAPDAPAYAPGGKYLLRLHPDEGASVRQFTVPFNGNIIVKNDRIYPEKILADHGAWAGFVPGTEYRKVAATFKRVALLKACP
jgi:hypothetical protein